MDRHHRGGADLVQRELADGINPEARAMADQLRISQASQLDDLAPPS